MANQMTRSRLSRRGFLGFTMAIGSSAVLVACGGAPLSAPSKPDEAGQPAIGGAKPTASAQPAAETKPAPKPSPTPRVNPVPKKAGATDLTIWFHWGGATGDFAQELINEYNTTQGEQDKIYVTIQTVAGGEYRQRMTAARLAGTTPDVYHTSVPIKEVVKNEIVAELPMEEQQYVKANYHKGPVDRMTFQGKIWGYPTEHQAPALIYRKSYLTEIGAEPPKTTLEVRELAKRLTKTEAGKKTRYGFTQWYDNYPATFHLPGLIARHGGQMWHFEGDRPIKIELDTPEAIEAVSWWRSMVDDGVTQVGEMPFTDAWQNGFAAMGEIEVWFTLINLRDAGKNDIYEDLGVVPVPPKPGITPIVQAGGWHLVAGSQSKYPDERLKFMKWMMYKPNMPFSRFIVERVGALPAPIEYPTPIPGWSPEANEGYAKQTVAIAEMNPSVNVFGSGEIDKVISTAIQAVMLKQQSPEEALKEINPRVNEILQRTDAE